MDMVELDGNGRIWRIEIKPTSTDLLYTWVIAVWTPVFSWFMHEKLPSVNVTEKKEVFLGNLLQAAIDKGLLIESLIFSEGTYLDIGTPADLMKAVQSGILL